MSGPENVGFEERPLYAQEEPRCTRIGCNHMRSRHDACGCSECSCTAFMA